MGERASVPVQGAEPGEARLLSTPHTHPQEKEETVNDDKGGRRDGETNGDSWRCGQGEERYVLTPFANNGFLKKDFHVLGSQWVGMPVAQPFHI